MGRRSREAWGTLTRRELTGQFDDIATRAIMYAMDRGGTGRISRKGHAIIRGPGGRTMSIPGHGARSQQVIEMEVRKMFPDDDEPKPEAARPPIPAHLRDRRHDLTANPTLECPANNCPAVFVTEGARYDHIAKTHERCRLVECPYVARDKRGETAHFRIVHQGDRPAAKKRASRARPAGPRTRPAASVDEDTQTTPAPPEASPTDPDIRRAVDDLQAQMHALRKTLAEIADLLREVSS